MNDLFTGITLTISDTDGKIHETKFNVPSLNCKAKNILGVKSLPELAELIKKSTEKDYEDYINDYFNDVISNVGSLEHVKSVSVKRTYAASGDYSSYLLSDVSYRDDDFRKIYSLALEIAGGECEDKERARAELTALLNTCVFSLQSEGGAKWPSNLLGTKPKISVSWENVSSDVDGLANAIYNEELCDSFDDAVETVTIDMKTKKITSEAKYILHLKSEIEGW